MKSLSTPWFQYLLRSKFKNPYINKILNNISESPNQAHNVKHKPSISLVTNKFTKEATSFSESALVSIREHLRAHTHILIRPYVYVPIHTDTTTRGLALRDVAFNSAREERESRIFSPRSAFIPRTRVYVCGWLPRVMDSRGELLIVRVAGGKSFSRKNRIAPGTYVPIYVCTIVHGWLGARRRFELEADVYRKFYEVKL